MHLSLCIVWSTTVVMVLAKYNPDCSVSLKSSGYDDNLAHCGFCQFEIKEGPKNRDERCELGCQKLKKKAHGYCRSQQLTRSAAGNRVGLDDCHCVDKLPNRSASTPRKVG
ncbi:hypothetical protein HDE_04918 [Halotydeus destructor]|nr:hypothetical protein HDE_04918 [Halotydeus destructor]